MSAIAENVMAEHVSQFFDCSCGHNITPPRTSPFTTHADMYGRHIAEVTEQAVRAQIAADIRNYAGRDIPCWKNDGTRAGVVDAYQSILRLVTEGGAA